MVGSWKLPEKFVDHLTGKYQMVWIKEKLFVFQTLQNSTVTFNSIFTLRYIVKMVVKDV